MSASTGPARSRVPARSERTRETAHPSPRAVRTRAQLVEASRRVFERDGFLNARIADIAEEAGVAIGSFYTYFKSKREIFIALMEGVQEEMLHSPRVSGSHEIESVAASVYAANREYLEAYRGYAALMAVLEEVAVTDPAFRAVRWKRSIAFTERNARMVERLQAQGIADQALDPQRSAQSLSGMVSRAAYQAFVLGVDDDIDELSSNLSRLWLNALGVGPTYQEPMMTAHHSSENETSVDG
jgi:AcrR family transcriptional regulator